VKNILIVDDEDKLRKLLSRIIKLEGFEIFQAADCRRALKILERQNIDVAICDVKLPDGNGVELTKTIKENHPATEVILLTAYGNIPDGVQAIKNGAFDYITKGDDNNKIIPLLHRAIEKVELTKRVQQLEQQLGDRYSFDSIVGKSKNIQDAIALAKRVAQTDSTVLLTGETGTGKEVFAQAIHQKGRRNNRPFVAANCATFGKELLESELFGHKVGAFTGAVKDKKGLFEEADSGTLFLDEIGELDLSLQAKLLRVIETGEFLKLGESRSQQTNVRIIAATNRNLESEIEKGRFREDLYYRIAVFTIKLPALNDRPADIEPLTLKFLHSLSTKMGKPVKRIHPKAIEALTTHAWRGNIRELKNVIERALILCDEKELNIRHLPSEFNAETGKFHPVSTFELAQAEKKHIQTVLNYTEGNKTKAARLLNIALTTLYRKISEYDIQG